MVWNLSTPPHQSNPIENEEAPEFYRKLKTRPRFRKAVQAARKLDKLQGEGAFLRENRETAKARREAQEAEERAERKRLRDEEYNKPENVARREREHEQYVANSIRLRREYAEEVNDPNFDLQEWLQAHDTNGDSVTVEIGHGIYPLAQHHSFKDGRVYIGLEANINDDFGADGRTTDVTEAIIHDPERRDEKIFFLDVNSGFDEELFHELDARLLYGIPRDPSAKRLEYDPESILPDGAADEVFLAHVLDDPRTGAGNNEELLLSEASRITAPDGKIIVAEYANRWYALPEQTLANAGLKIDRIIFWQDDPKEFQAMQERYHIFPSPDEVYPPSFLGLNFPLDNDASDRYRDINGKLRSYDNFYLILSKIPDNKGSGEVAAF